MKGAWVLHTECREWELPGSLPEGAVRETAGKQEDLRSHRSVLGHRHCLHCLHGQHSDSLQNRHLFSTAKPAQVNSMCGEGGGDDLICLFFCLTEF